MSTRGVLLLVIWVGVMLGRAFLPAQSTEEQCALEQPLEIRVVGVRQLTGGSAQYEGQTPAGCSVLVSLPRFPAYAAGNVLTLTGRVETTAEWERRNAGYARYLARQAIAGTMRYPTVELVEQATAARTLRQNLIEHTQAAFREPEGAALVAMMWGEGVRLPRDVEDNFRRVGVTHILAISGFNLTLVAAGLWALAWRLPLPGWVTVALVTALVWGYVALVGAPVSAVRAAWFWTLVAAGLRIKWLVSPLTVMLLTVAVMLTVDPKVIFDVGFQLSLAAVAGIWLAWFVSKPHFAKAPRGREFFGWLLTLVITTIGATLATAPIVAYHFGLISLTTIIANIFIVPATVAFTYLGFFGLFVHYIFPPLALLISFGVHVIWQFMDWVTSFLAHVPGLTLTDVSVPWVILPAYYAAVMVLCAWWLRRQGRAWREVWAP